jgi:hypothetical protein
MNVVITSVVGSHNHESEAEESETCWGQSGDLLTQFCRTLHVTA